jgi:solute carrier family 24 (sodium/potassium/calcium exchanger), member 6
MGETLAGVTLLAFGNGSPDIFASLANYRGDTELTYTELIGAAAFVTGFIAGITIILNPFRVVRQNAIRDVLFFLAAVFYIHYTIEEGYFTPAEGIITCSFYVVYIAYVIIDHILMKKKVKKLKNKSSVLSMDSKSTTNIIKKVEEIEEIVDIQIRSRRNTAEILTEEKIKKSFLIVIENENSLKTFFKSLNPIDIEDWKKSGIISKVLVVLKVIVEL